MRNGMFVIAYWPASFISTSVELWLLKITFSIMYYRINVKLLWFYRYATNSTQYCVLFSGGINLNLQGNLQSATKHGNPANFISSYKSASDPKTSLVLGEIENDALVFYYKNCFDVLWEKIVLAIEKKSLKFEAEGHEFAKILRSIEQFVRTVKQFLVA